MHFQLLHTYTYTTGIGSYKWQTHHSHQSGRHRREKEFQTTGLSPVQPSTSLLLVSAPLIHIRIFILQYTLKKRSLYSLGDVVMFLSISFVQNHTRLVQSLVRILRMTFPHRPGIKCTDTHSHRHRHTQAHACTSSDLCSISLWPSTQVQQTLEPLAAVMKAKSAVSNLV